MTETLIGTKWVSSLNKATYTVVDQTEHPAAMPGLPQNDMITLLCETPTKPHPVNVQPVIPQQIVTIRVGYLPELFRKHRDPQPIEDEVTISGSAVSAISVVSESPWDQDKAIENDPA